MLPFEQVIAIEAGSLSEALHTPSLLGQYGHILSNVDLFSQQPHKVVSEGIAKALLKNVVPNADTIYNYVPNEAHGALKRVLNSRVPVESYSSTIDSLRDSYVGRESMKTLELAMTDLRNGNIKTADQVLQRVDEAVINLYNFAAGRPLSITEATSMLRKTMTETVVNGEPPGGLYMHWWPELAKMLGHLRRTELVIVGARPGHGKTSWLISLAYHAATLFRKTHSSRRILYITAEEIAEDIAGRTLKAFDENFSDEWIDANTHPTMDKIASVFEEGEWPIDIMAVSELSPSNVNRVVREYIRQHGPYPIVLIDYLQLMKADSEHGTDAANLSSVIRTLKLGALDNEAIYLLAAQLKRDVDLRKEATYYMSDLQGTSGAEQHANKAMFLVGSWSGEDDSDEYHEKFVSVVIVKNRRGRIVVKLHKAARLPFIAHRSFMPAGTPNLTVIDKSQVPADVAAQLGL